MVTVAGEVLHGATLAPMNTPLLISHELAGEDVVAVQSQLRRRRSSPEKMVAVVGYVMVDGEEAVGCRGWRCWWRSVEELPATLAGARRPEEEEEKMKMKIEMKKMRCASTR